MSRGRRHEREQNHASQPLPGKARPVIRSPSLDSSGKGAVSPVDLNGAGGPDDQERGATAPTPAPPPYRTVVADPPWRYDNGGGATKAKASKHYDTMSLGEIMALRDKVTTLASRDAHLWLWTTNAFIEEGYDVVRAWGFRPLTLLTWCKEAPGIGHYLRNNTEHCILASRGAPLVPQDKAMASWYVWPRGAHSAKPEAFYDLVEQVSPAPYLEMFSRRARLGWDVWGDESLGTVAA